MLANITSAIATTLWCCAYADGIENDYINGPAPLGDDWEDYAPTPPPEAYDTARKLLASIGQRKVLDTAAHWMGATNADEFRFGHCLAMQALGHGVGLQDDMPAGQEAPALDVPLIEFSIYYVDISDMPDVFLIEAVPIRPIDTNTLPSDFRPRHMDDD